MFPIKFCESHVKPECVLCSVVLQDVREGALAAFLLGLKALATADRSANVPLLSILKVGQRAAT